jgi:hypothetical protein
MVGSISLAQAQESLKSETINNTRNMRFCEILVVKLKGIEVYNTTGVSDCPPQLWDNLNLKQIRRQHRAIGRSMPIYVKRLRNCVGRLPLRRSLSDLMTQFGSEPRPTDLDTLCPRS